MACARILSRARSAADLRGSGVLSCSDSECWPSSYSVSIGIIIGHYFQWIETLYIGRSRVDYTTVLADSNSCCSLLPISTLEYLLNPSKPFPKGS